VVTERRHSRLSDSRYRTLEGPCAFSSAEVHQALFPKRAPKPRTVEQLKKGMGIWRYVRHIAKLDGARKLQRPARHAPQPLDNGEAMKDLAPNRTSFKRGPE
jgi:hypothetical protein